MTAGIWPAPFCLSNHRRRPNLRSCDAATLQVSVGIIRLEFSSERNILLCPQPTCGETVDSLEQIKFFLDFCLLPTRVILLLCVCSRFECVEIHFKLSQAMNNFRFWSRLQYLGMILVGDIVYILIVNVWYCLAGSLNLLSGDLNHVSCDFPCFSMNLVIKKSGQRYHILGV